MAVIINELEVVLESEASAPSTQAAARPPQSPQAMQQLQPIDLLDMVERETRNELRVLAH